jgi:hypothetical protein
MCALFDYESLFAFHTHTENRMIDPSHDVHLFSLVQYTARVFHLKYRRITLVRSTKMTILDGFSMCRHILSIKFEF